MIHRKKDKESLAFKDLEYIFVLFGCIYGLASGGGGGGNLNFKPPSQGIQAIKIF